MRTKWLLALVVTVAVVAFWRSRTSDAPNPKLVFDRFWVDHEPHARGEHFKVFFVSGEEPFGRFVNRTMWTGLWEAFHYHVKPAHDGVIDVYFGETNEWQQLRYAARPCREQGFDFCLDVAGTSRGVKRYYSKKEWGAHTVGDVDTLAERLAAKDAATVR